MNLLGTLLGGRYRLDAKIGHGGMSTVYRAFDTVLERPVAIKLMHREIASDSEQVSGRASAARLALLDGSTARRLDGSTARRLDGSIGMPWARRGRPRIAF